MAFVEIRDGVGTGGSGQAKRLANSARTQARLVYRARGSLCGAAFVDQGAPVMRADLIALGVRAGLGRAERQG